jgi:CRISPR-associated protein (TIGR03986 family)
MKKKNLLLMYEKASSIMKGTRGTIVFTGQPSVYRIGGRHKKHLEFLFYDVKDHAIGIQHLKKDFKFIHSDDKGVPNKEWNFWARKLDKGERVPIFYLVDGTGIPFAMGLAMMFRLPYKNSIDDAISHSSATHTKSTPDLSELIFGHINENGALRGRVQFGLFKAENHPAPMETYIAVLGSPKPTFYPNYIRQNLNSASGKINGNYITYMDDNCKIAGWKRYPVRADATIPDKDELISLIPENEKTKAKNFDVATSFKPLSSGTKFSGKLKFHNLRPMELGALLWALRFGSNGNLRHNIGMAKPLGFGSVTMKIRNQSLPNEIDLDKVCSDFEKLMVMKYPGWRDSDQIKELLAMADPRRSDESVLNYPSLANKDFSNFKKDNAALIPYSQMTIVKQSRLAKPNGLKQDSPELELPEISPAVKLIKTVKNNINGNASELKKMLNQLSSITEKEYDELGKLISRRNDYSNEYAQTTRDYKNAYNDLKKKILKPQ